MCSLELARDSEGSLAKRLSDNRARGSGMPGSLGVLGSTLEKLALRQIHAVKPERGHVCLSAPRPPTPVCVGGCHLPSSALRSCRISESWTDPGQVRES